MSSSRLALQRLLIPLLLSLLGVGMALCLLTLGLMLFPAALIGSISYYDRPVRGQTLELHVREADGDLFVALPGRVRPPQDNRTLGRFTVHWDSDGFRRPLRQAARYPIVVFGDSFTEGFNVPVPWPDRLAQLLDTPVKNNGYRGYGPQEVRRAAAESLRPAAHDWLIYAYFAGNDLGDAVRPPKVDTASPLALWDALFRRMTPHAAGHLASAEDENRHYDYPMPVIIGSSYYEQVFLPYYLWWNTAPPQGFAASRNYAVVVETLQALDAQLSPQVCRALAFLPTKEQVYYRYIYPTERRWLREGNNRLEVDARGMIQFVSAPLSEEAEPAYLDQLYNQRDAIAALVAARPGWRFIDLLPAFDAAAARGEMLYYVYDSHWNQAGHDLAARVIAEALGIPPQCP